MSTDARDSQSEDSLESRIEKFMMRNFPQIQMHGGSAAIESIDEESGEVWLRLGGACSGCGISPMTIQALKTRMISEFEEVTQVHADTGAGAPAEGPLAGDDEFDDVPF